MGKYMKVLSKKTKSTDMGRHISPVGKNMKGSLNQEKPMVWESLPFQMENIILEISEMVFVKEKGSGDFPMESTSSEIFLMT